MARMKKSSYTTVKATSQHDAELRKLLSETPLQGTLRVTLESEPSFFSGDHDVVKHDAVLVSHQQTPVACGSRLLRRVCWHGSEQHVAYLAHLRLHPSWQKRGGHALIEGYRMIGTFSHDSPAVATWTAIFRSNSEAQSTLTGQRAGLPNYVARGKLHSALILIRRKHRWPHHCARARAEDMPAITRFLQQELCRRPLAPIIHGDDLTNGQRWPDLRPEDFVMVKKNDEIIGVTAVRDLRNHKQVRVTQLPPLWKLARQPSIFLAACHLCPPIPQQGSVLALGYASFFTVKEDDPITAKMLMRAATVVAAEKKLSFLSVAFHENDPKRQAIDSLLAIKTDGDLYQVIYDGDVDSWPEQRPYIDPANL